MFERLKGHRKKTLIVEFYKVFDKGSMEHYLPQVVGAGREE